jgi:hypothetical protein
MVLAHIGIVISPHVLLGATLYTLHDLTKRMSEKPSLKIDKGLLYPMPGQNLEPCWVGRKFLPLQPRG